MSQPHESINSTRDNPTLSRWSWLLDAREDQVFLILTLVIGWLTLTVVAFIVLTEHSGMRLFPAGSAAGRQSIEQPGKR